MFMHIILAASRFVGSSVLSCVVMSEATYFNICFRHMFVSMCVCICVYPVGLDECEYVFSVFVFVMTASPL